MSDLIKKIKSKNFKNIYRTIKNEFDKDAILFTVLLAAILFFGITKFLLPSFNNIFIATGKYLEKKDAVNKMQQRLDKRNNQKIVKKDLPINIYETPIKNVDLQSASVDMVENLINLVKETGVKRINQLNFNEVKVKDNIGIVSENHKILRISLTLVTNYESLQSFLNEVYLMDQLIGVKTLSIAPIKEANFEYLNAYLTLDLYVKVK